MIVQLDFSTIQTGAILIAVATFLGALVGAISQFLIRWYYERKSKRNLRKAFLAELKESPDFSDKEIQSFQAPIDYSQEPFDYTNFLMASAPTTIYEQNSGRLGMLEAEEVEALVEYYSLIPTAEHRLEFDRNIISKIEEAIAGVEYADGEEKEEVIGALDDNVLKNLERYLELLEQTRQNAISELESRV